MGPVNIGVDIGQRVDPSAIAVVECTSRAADTWEAHQVTRLPLGTPYPDVVTRIIDVASKVRALIAARRAQEEEEEPAAPERGGHEGGDARAAARLSAPRRARVTVFLDCTGVGAPLVDELRRRGLGVTPVYLTASERRVVQPDGSISLGKAWLVARLTALIEHNRLRWPETLPDGEALRRELLSYDIRRSSDSATLTFGAMKTGEHDDQVTALGLAVQVAPPAPIPLEAALLGGGVRFGSAYDAERGGPTRRVQRGRYPF